MRHFSNHVPFKTCRVLVAGQARTPSRWEGAWPPEKKERPFEHPDLSVCPRFSHSCPHVSTQYYTIDLAVWVVPVQAPILARVPEGLSTLVQRASPMTGTCGDQLVPHGCTATNTRWDMCCGCRLLSHCACSFLVSFPLTCYRLCLRFHLRLCLRNVRVLIYLPCLSYLQGICRRFLLCGCQPPAWTRAHTPTQ
jgi:hypothetical protein